MLQRADEVHRVRRLISAIIELRWASTLALTVAQDRDVPYPCHGEHFWKCLRTVQTLNDGIAAHLEFGISKPGQFETRIRKYTKRLAMTMEFAITPAADHLKHPLPKSIGKTAWKLLDESRMIEDDLAIVTVEAEVIDEEISRDDTTAKVFSKRFEPPKLNETDQKVANCINANPGKRAMLLQGHATLDLNTSGEFSALG